MDERKVFRHNTTLPAEELPKVISDEANRQAPGIIPYAVAASMLSPETLSMLYSQGLIERPLNHSPADLSSTHEAYH